MGLVNADFVVDEVDLKVYRNFVEGGMGLGMWPSSAGISCSAGSADAGGE